MLFLRGLRWRRSFSIAVLLVGVIGASVAAIGPLYARAAGESTLTDELRAGAPGSGLTFTYETTADEPAAQVIRLLGKDAQPRFFDRPILGASATVTATAPRAAGSTATTLAWRDDLCGHVVLRSGRCVAGPGEVIVPSSAVTSAPRWRPGQQLRLREGIYLRREGVTADGQPLPAPLRIVGVYRPRDANEPYWFGRPYFRSTLGPAVAAAIKGGADAIFVSRGQYESLPAFLTSQAQVDVPLDANAVRLDDVPQLRREVAAVQARFPRTASPVRPSMRTEIAAVLAAADRDRRQVDIATLVVVLELAALSLLVLFHVVGGAVEARGDEIALAKLRGLRPARTVLFALGEPIGLLLLALPIGFGLAVAVAHVLVGSALVPGTPVAVTGAVGWALAAAFAGSALAGLLAAYRTVTRPVLEQWRNTSPRCHASRRLLALDVAIAAAAAATVVALRLGDRPGAVSLLAPALVVFAVALLGVRVLPFLGRRLLPRTRASRHIATFLALRQTVRRPGGLRLGVLLAVAVGLATFAICGEVVARANRDARAHTELGAPRRIAVQYDVDHDPQAIVRRVDPSHRWAMAAARWLPDGGASDGSDTMTGPLLGVEPQGLRHVGYDVRGQLSTDAIGGDITAPVVAPVAFRGTRLRVAITTTELRGDRPAVVFQVRDAATRVTQVNAARLRTGSAEYTAAVDCQVGCTFAGIAFSRSFDAPDVIAGSVTVSALSVADGGAFRPLPVRLDTVRAWRSNQLGVGASSQFDASRDGLRVRFRASDGSSPVLDYADSPTRLPMVAAPGATGTTASTGGVVDYSGTAVGYRIERRASPLPVVLDTGAIANLTYLRTRLPNFDVEAAWSVWLGPAAPADATARLERAGLLVERVDTAAARVEELGRQGPALGLLLLLVCAIAAAVLAIGGTAVSVLADARRRAFELAALRVVGVPQRTLRRSAVAEQGVLLGAGVVLGVPAGYAAAALVLPVVPEFSDATPTVLRFAPPVLVALACGAAFVLLLVVTAVIAGRALVRAAVPARLREAAR